MEIVREGRDYAVLYKAAGEDSERDMPHGLFCIHRLDRAASGLLVYAGSKKAAAALSEQLLRGEIKKSYLIVVKGHLTEPEGELRDYLYKDSRKQKMFPVKKIRAGVKEAILRYSLIEEQFGFSLIRVWLVTGRFHQIRAQFAARGLPLLGDGKYGSRIKCSSIALFCDRLYFKNPENGEEIEVELPMPESFPWKGIRDV